MDYPDGQIAVIPVNMIDSAVYVNSVTYGRLGILTLETNTVATTAQTMINSAFKKLFSSGSSFLTTQERTFLAGCDFKVYLIGGAGKTMVETFTGLDGFLNHIKKGTFSKDQPGVPLFCTFNHVKDNSPVSINFKFSVKRQPLYIEMVYKPIPNKSNIGDIHLCFYESRSKVPVIANPAIKFKVRKEIWDRVLDRQPFDPLEKVKPDTFYEFTNAGYQTSIQIFSLVSLGAYSGPHSVQGPQGNSERIDGYELQNRYYLVGNDNFVIMGTNPIMRGNY